MFNLQRVASVLGRNVYRSFSSTTAPAPVVVSTRLVVGTISTEGQPNNGADAANKKVESAAAAVQQRSKNPMVAAAFDSLSKEESAAVVADKSTKPDELDDRIINAKTVASLLSVAEGNASVTRKHALKIVSILAEWSSINRVQLADFENDARFIKLCRLLGRAVPKQTAASAAHQSKIAGFRTDDLNTVIGVAGDDEAAKLIASISIPQMIKVMSALAQKKRRSTPLLRSLAYNISNNSEQLDLKQCADLMYAMAVLNFPDTVLIGRISMDVQSGLAQNLDKPAAVGSIITSLGLLKYRDADLLESLTDWVLQHADICRPQDVSSLFYSLAVLNYPTTKSDAIKTKLVAALDEQDFTKPLDWLNNVWALVVLNLAEHKHIASVLSSTFLERLLVDREQLSPTIKMKLLNIDGAARLLQTGYTGDKLSATSNATVFEVPLTHSKNKQVLVNGLLDALKSLFASESSVRTHVDTKMGFVIDAECVLDAKNNPLPLDGEHKNATRLAIMVLDFHDMSQGAHQQPNGLTALAFQLLEHQGYHVLQVPYNEFSTSDKLLKRVQYLEGKLKRIASSNAPKQL